SDGFSFELIVDPEINLQHVKFPSLLSQPIVENAIRHGLIHLNGVKMLTIEIKGTSEEYSFNIIDNGIGREASSKINAVKQAKHTSFASSAIKERIEFLNQGGIMKVACTIEDLP